jgi:hypothetical protein
MEPLSFASFGIGVGSSILGGALGFEQADQQRAETAEQVRRFNLLSRRTTSEATAAGNASGITSDSGSLTKYLAEMSAEFGRQADWMRAAGEQRADNTEMSALFGMAGDLGGSLFKFGASNNWFRKPTI